MKKTLWIRGMLLWAALAVGTLDAAVPSKIPAKQVDNQTLTGKVMCGYQGWFNCPDDGASLGWTHYSKRGQFKPGACTIDYWADVSELSADEKFATPFRHADGTVAYTFSSRHPMTVDRHFKWMSEYGIDGVFLQRFAVNTRSGKRLEHCDQVLRQVRQSAQKYGRLYAVMYDLSGMRSEQMTRVYADFKHLHDDFGIGRDQNDRSYAHHQNKPVVAVWGVGFKDGRDYTLKDCAALIRFLKEDPVYGGNAVLLGVPSYWRQLRNDATSDAYLHEVIKMADIVHPWAVGRYNSEDPADLDRYAQRVWNSDMQWCRKNQLTYMPVIYPGFSWHNMYGDKLGAISRQGGQFFWRQFYKVIAEAKATMIYVAMFDEMDEGTCIFKCTNDPPVGESPFLKYDQGKGERPDHYLWLTGEGARMLRGERPLSEKMPVRP